LVGIARASDSTGDGSHSLRQAAREYPKNSRPSSDASRKKTAGEQGISELCRREGIAANPYYRWSKDFLEAGKKQLAGDTAREATSNEVKELRAENSELKEVVAEFTLKNRVLKKV